LVINGCSIGFAGGEGIKLLKGDKISISGNNFRTNTTNHISCAAAVGDVTIGSNFFDSSAAVSNSNPDTLLVGGLSYTVANLPSTAKAGSNVFASNCRVFNGTGTREGAGSGTGGLVTWNGSAWTVAGTNVAAAA